MKKGATLKPWNPDPSSHSDGERKTRESLPQKVKRKASVHIRQAGKKWRICRRRQTNSLSGEPYLAGRDCWNKKIKNRLENLVKNAGPSLPSGAKQNGKKLSHHPPNIKTYMGKPLEKKKRELSKKIGRRVSNSGSVRRAAGTR